MGTNEEIFLEWGQMNKLTMTQNNDKWSDWLRIKTNDMAGYWQSASSKHCWQTIGTSKLCRRMTNIKWLKIKTGPLWREKESLDKWNRNSGILTCTAHMFQSFIFSVKSHPLKSDYLQCTTIGFFEQSTYVSLSQYYLTFVTAVYLSIVLNLLQQFISVLSYISFNNC